MATESVTPLSSAQLLGGPDIREFIGLAGKDGTGKSSAVVSLAWYVQQMHPEAQFFVEDTENKFRSALKSFGADAPTNIIYYKCDTMNQVTSSTAEVLRRHRPGDWLAVESLSRIWERAQDLGYQVREGVNKVEYLERRRDKGSKSPIPGNVADFWAIVKGAHDSAFFDLLTQSEDLNVIATTTIAKPPKEGFIKESVDRKAVRVELGIDANLEGAPRIPYYFETLCLLDVRGGQVSCRVLRDNLSTKDETRVEFAVPTRRDWALEFWGQCR
jgi:hypothetical protein